MNKLSMLSIALLLAGSLSACRGSSLSCPPTQVKVCADEGDIHGVSVQDGVGVAPV